MAKVMITLEDADDGGVDVHSVYEPALGELEEPTGAQSIGMAINRLASEGIEGLEDEKAY